VFAVEESPGGNARWCVGTPGKDRDDWSENLASNLPTTDAFNMSLTMETMMNALSKAILGAAAALALTAGAAPAAVVCNQEGDCWRVSGEPRYEPGLNLRIMKDDWKWQEHEKDKYRWREPGRGHGHWHNGVWVEIR